LKVFVTGATGKVGRVLVEEMLKRGWTVDAFALPEDDTAVLEDWGVRVSRGDITDAISLDNAIAAAGSDVLFHLAGYVQLGDLGTKENEQRMQDVNVIGTRNVLNSALQHNVKKAVYLSSVAIFAPSNGSNIIAEDTQIETNHPGAYGQTKYLAHQEAMKIREQGLELLIFMPGIIFGPGFPGTVFLIESLKSGRLRYLPDILSKTSVPLVFSRDLSQAIFAAIEKDRFGEQYILVESSPYFKNIAMLAAELSGSKITPKLISYRRALFYAWMAEAGAKLSRRSPRITCERVRDLFARVRDIKYSYQFDTSKARTELNWQPTSLEDAIKETVDWYTHDYSKKAQEGN